MESRGPKDQSGHQLSGTPTNAVHREEETHRSHGQALDSFHPDFLDGHEQSLVLNMDSPLIHAHFPKCKIVFGCCLHTVETWRLPDLDLSSLWRHETPVIERWKMKRKRREREHDNIMIRRLKIKMQSEETTAEKMKQSCHIMREIKGDMIRMN